MKTPADDRQPTEPGDELIARYHEATTLEGATPEPNLRAAVLAQAQVMAWKHADDDLDRPQELVDSQIDGDEPVRPETAATPLPGANRYAAANDRRWIISAVASIAVLGLAGLLALQFDRSPPHEQELALGRGQGEAPPAATEPHKDKAPAVESLGPPGPSSPAPTDTMPAAPPPSPTAEAAPSPAITELPVQPAERPELPAPIEARTDTAEDESNATGSPRVAQDDIAMEQRPAQVDMAREETSPQTAAAAEPGEATVAPTLTPPQAPESAQAAAPTRPAPHARKAASPATRDRAAARRAGDRKAEARNRGAAPDHAASAVMPAEDAANEVAAPVTPRPGPVLQQAEQVTPATAAPGSHTAATASGAPALTARQTLLVGATSGQGELVRAALAQGVSPNATDDAGRTALMLAARRGDVAIARQLVEAGADVRRTDSNGLDAAGYARRAGHDALASWLAGRSAPGR